MKKLPNNTLTEMSKKTGFPVQYLSDLVNTTKRPGRARAKLLEEKTGVPAIMWLYGTAKEIKHEVLAAPDRLHPDR